VRVRAVANGNVLDVVEGDPQSSGQISRAQAEAWTPLGIFEVIEEVEVRPAAPLTIPEGELRNVAHGKPPQPARTRRPRAE
jgi:hypothetical protein